MPPVLAQQVLPIFFSTMSHSLAWAKKSLNLMLSNRSNPRLPLKAYTPCKVLK